MESNLIRFIRERQRHCSTLVDVVSVRWIGGGKLNQCFKNAYDMCERDEVFAVSGWLLLPYDKVRQRQQLTQHWWNYSNALDRYIDVSPDIEDGAIYIIDMDIAHFAMRNNARLNSCVPMSLLYQEGRFFGINADPAGWRLEALPELTTEALFSPYLVSTDGAAAEHNEAALA